MKKLILLALVVLSTPLMANAWVCQAVSPNGAAGVGASPYLAQAQALAVAYCQEDGGLWGCAVLSCQ